MKVQIAFYKAKGDWVDKAIRIWTRSPYSHCEIVIGDIWYSSSPRDNGVRAKLIEPKEGHWDFVDIDIDFNKFKEFYKQRKGIGYDFTAIIFSHIVPLGFHSKTKYICSEFIAEFLGYKNPHTFSPDDLYKQIKGL